MLSTTARPVDRSSPGYDADRTQIKARIHRIAGQVHGLAKMVDSDEYCLDILTQINAVKGAVNQLALRLLEAHVKRCLSAGEVDVDHLMQAVDRFS
jgi:CsoR family transcriptional regulator, copper-sensing transcriptional repressor